MAIKTPVRTQPEPWLALGAAAILAAIVLLGALYADPPFLSGTTALYIIGYTFAAVAHALAFSLIAYPPIRARERRRGRASRLLKVRRNTLLFRHRWLAFTVGVLVVVALIFLDWWIVYGAQLGSVTTLGYFLACALGIAIVLAQPWLKMNSRLQQQTQEILFTTVDGLVLGCVTIVLLIGITSGIRQSNLPTVDFAPISLPTNLAGGPYVSLGDSYAAGEGLDPFDDTSGCHRSLRTQDYTNLIAHALGQPRSTQNLRACSGAVISDIYSARAFLDNNGKVVAPQVGSDIRPDVKLVTLMIGGNDIEWTKIIPLCFEVADCRRTFFTPQDGSMPPAATLSKWVPAAIGVMADRYDQLFGHLRMSFPNARILVIGYPYLLPAGPGPPVPDDCASVLRRLSMPVRDWIRSRMDDLSNVIYFETVRTHVEYISPDDVWKGHEACGSSVQFTNSVRPVLNAPMPISGGSFHPNDYGQNELAELIANYLTQYPTDGPSPFQSGQSSLPASPTSYCPKQLGINWPFGETSVSCPGPSSQDPAS